MKKSKKTNLIILNLHILIDVIAIVLIWRGIWHLADAYLFPQNSLMSNISGIIIGIALLLKDNKILNELISHQKK